MIYACFDMADETIKNQSMMWSIFKKIGVYIYVVIKNILKFEWRNILKKCTYVNKWWECTGSKKCKIILKFK